MKSEMKAIINKEHSNMYLKYKNINSLWGYYQWQSQNPLSFHAEMPNLGRVFDMDKIRKWREIDF